MGSERGPGTQVPIRREHLVVLWALGAVLTAAVLVRWGWRSGWWVPRARLEAGSLPEYRIDLNRAGEAELMLLPGIGEVKARRIVTYRREHGPFGRLEDLLAVEGISESVLQRITPYVSVGPARYEGEEPSPDDEHCSR